VGKSHRAIDCVTIAITAHAGLCSEDVVRCSKERQCALIAPFTVDKNRGNAIWNRRSLLDVQSVSRLKRRHDI
jgi:hypothetical protein